MNPSLCGNVRKVLNTAHITPGDQPRVLDGEKFITSRMNISDISEGSNVPPIIIESHSITTSTVLLIFIPFPKNGT